MAGDTKVHARPVGNGRYATVITFACGHEWTRPHVVLPVGEQAAIRDGENLLARGYRVCDDCRERGR